LRLALQGKVPQNIVITTSNPEIGEGILQKKMASNIHLKQKVPKL
jgi:hypothetical protein